MVHLITYDLHKPDRDYKDVIDQIKSFGPWAHDEESVWLVDTTMTPGECRDALKLVTKEATYFVARLHNSTWASFNVGSAVTAWLKSDRRNW